MPEKGLYANLNAKRKRIAAGSGEKMRSPAAREPPLRRRSRKQQKPRRNGKNSLRGNVMMEIGLAIGVASKSFTIVKKMASGPRP